MMFAILGWKKKKPETLEEKLKKKRLEMETRFHNLVDKCARKEIDREIECLVSKHVAYVLETIFRYAKNEVLIFTYGLDEAIFSKKNLILETIKFLLKPATKLKIVYKDPNLKKKILNTEFMKNISIPLTKDKIEIWDASENAQINQNDSYFWFNDRHDFAKGPKGVARSTEANFGNKFSGDLGYIFLDLITKSKKVL